MKFNVQAPPTPTGRYGSDIASLYSWCVTLHRKVGAVFRSIEDGQIKSVGADKLDSGDYFRLGNDDSYIEYVDGVIHIGGIVDDGVATTTTLEEMTDICDDLDGAMPDSDIDMPSAAAEKEEIADENDN